MSEVEILSYVKRILDKCRRTTIIKDESSLTLPPGGKINLLEQSGSGRIHEVTIISPTPSFSLTITVDGNVVWDKSYDSASSYTDDVEFISAFQRDDGKYIYHVCNIPFRENISIDLSNLDTDNSITIDHVFIKYEAG